MDNNAFLEQWLAAQKVYWEALARGEDSPPPLQEPLFKVLRDTLGKQLPDSHEALGETLERQGELFRQLGEHLLRDAADSGQTFTAPPDAEDLQRWFDRSAASFLGLSTLADTLSGGWGGPHGSADKPTHLLQSFQRAQLRYLGLHAGVLHQATLALQAELLNGKSGYSVAGLIARWSHCYESRYRQLLGTSTFQQAHGELINSWLRLQRHLHQQQGSQARLFGLVSQQEHTDLARSHQALKRELRGLQQQLNAQQKPTPAGNPGQPSVERLEREVEALRARLEQLLADPPPPRGQD